VKLQTFGHLAHCRNLSLTIIAGGGFFGKETWRYGCKFGIWYWCGIYYIFFAQGIRTLAEQSGFALMGKLSFPS